MFETCNESEPEDSPRVLSQIEFILQTTFKDIEKYFST